MTNEELCLAAQSGDRAAMVELWNSVKPLCFQLGKKYLVMFYQSGMDTDDFLQELFCAVWHAVKKYDSSRGSFNTFLFFYVQNQCRKVLKIQHSEDITNQLHNRTLYEPVSGDTDGLTLIDMLPDQSAEEAFCAAEDRQDNIQMRCDIEAALSQLTPEQAQMLRDRYYNGMTIRQIAAKQSKTYSAAHQLEQRALRQLRRKSKRTKDALHKYRDEYMTAHATSGTSYSAWKQGGSVQERIVERMDDLGYYGVTEKCERNSVWGKNWGINNLEC